MELPIARGRVSHSLTEDFLGLIRAVTLPLEDEAIVSEAESLFANYVGRSACVVFPFARTGIHSILKSLSLKPGDRVLLPALTIKPILDVVLSLNLEPVFVDVDESTACFDHEALKDSIKLGPRVAILTYLFGLVPDMDQILPELREAGIFVIEDFSQCLNGKWKSQSIGTFGDAAVYSASSIKTFDTFGGGFVVSDDPSLVSHLRCIRDELGAPRRLDLISKVFMSLIRNFATQRVIFGLITWPLIRITKGFGKGIYLRFVGSRDEHPIVELPSAWFRKFTAVQARVAIEQLPKTRTKDAKRVSRINEVDSGHNYVDRPTGNPEGSHVHWQHLFYADDVERFTEDMARWGIDCATTSLVLISSLPEYPFQSATPNALRLFRSGMYLPCYHQLTKSDAQRIGSALARFSS